MSGLLPAFPLQRILSLVFHIFTKDMETAAALMMCGGVCSLSSLEFQQPCLAFGPSWPLFRGAELWVLELQLRQLYRAMCNWGAVLVKNLLDVTSVLLSALLSATEQLWDVFPGQIMLENKPSYLNGAQISAPRLGQKTAWVSHSSGKVASNGGKCGHFFCW